MKRTTEQTTLMHQLLRELPLLENLAMRAGLHITCRAIQNAVRASGWEAAGDTERANYYAPNTEGFGAVGVQGASAPSNEELEALWEQHAGHPADFAADVLERWGGWPEGSVGYGGTHGVKGANDAQA